MKQEAFPVVSSDAWTSPLALATRAEIETKEHTGRKMIAINKYGGRERVTRVREVDGGALLK